MTEEPAVTRCGLVAIVGRPNVGKSTLLNHLVGQKVSITSARPQTTRHRILGIKTAGGAQVVYVDTPGLHRGAGRAINRAMNRVAQGALQDVDLVVFVIEALRWTEDDALVAERLGGSGLPPVILAVNKVDRVRRKEDLLPYLAELAARGPFEAVVPLEREVTQRLPEAPALFPTDQVTDRSERFLAGEIIREKLMRRLGEEVPYRLSVEVERFLVQGPTTRIDAVIWVEKPGQKAIVIGAGGKMLKAVGADARRDIERMIERPVY
nr:GTPase Era [Gammaproteobacteria bacterium]